MPKIFTTWRTARGTTINTCLVSVGTGAAEPLDGEPVYIDTGAGGIYTFMPTTPAAATTAQRTIAGGIVQGRNPRGVLYSPGRTAVSANEPQTVNIGGRGSRATSAAPAGQKFLFPINGDDMWLMTRRTATALVPGTGYGLYRAAAQDYFLDQANANDVMRVVGYYSVDVDQNLPVSSATSTDAVQRVWVRAALPGGVI